MRKIPTRGRPPRVFVGAWIEPLLEQQLLDAIPIVSAHPCFQYRRPSFSGLAELAMKLGLPAALAEVGSLLS